MTAYEVRIRDWSSDLCSSDLFAVTLGWLPPNAVPIDAEVSIWERVRHLILPVTTLALLRAGGITRYVRASMRETLRRDFIRTARSEEHTSELQSLMRNSYAVFCLKKKIKYSNKPCISTPCLLTTVN